MTEIVLKTLLRERSDSIVRQSTWKNCWLSSRVMAIAEIKNVRSVWSIWIPFRLSAKYPCGKGAGVVSLIGKDEQVFDTQYITIQVQSLTQFHSVGFLTIKEKCKKGGSQTYKNFFVRCFLFDGVQGPNSTHLMESFYFWRSWRNARGEVLSPSGVGNWGLLRCWEDE